MRIGLVAYKADNAVGSGSERYAYRLKQNLENRGHKVLVLGTDEKYPIMDRTLYSLIDVRGKMKEMESEVDLFHSVIPQECIYPQAVNKPVIYTWHDIIQLVTKRSGNSWKGKLFAKLFYKRATKADHHIAISSQTRNMVQSYYGISDDKITVINHGMDKKFRPIGREYTDKEKITFGYLGAMNERKRVDYIIEAYSAYLENNPEKESELVIYGKKSFQYPNLKEKVKKDKNIPNDKVRFEGFVPEEDIVGAYNNIDIFLFSSEREGWGYPITEAMACGAPVITRNSSIPREVTKPSIKANTPGEMAEKMKELSQDKKQRKRVAERQLKSIGQFTWDKCVENTLDVYEKVLNN